MTTSALVRRLAVGVGCLALSGAVGWRTGAVAAGGEIDPARTSQLVAALDGCIQERFKEVNERFGIRRVITVGQTPHVFRPEDAAELAAVKDLEAANLRVVLYLTGRRVLAPKPDTSGWTGARAWRLIKGPVDITRGPAVPPPPLSLWDESRRAIEAFATGDSYEFAVREWQFIAMPVRASDPVCLKCHGPDPARPSTPALGDPLGVVLYGVQPR